MPEAWLPVKNQRKWLINKEVHISFADFFLPPKRGVGVKIRKDDRKQDMTVGI